VEIKHPHGVVFAPHLGGGVLKKIFFATRTYPPYLYLTPPTFQILEISLVKLGCRLGDGLALNQLAMAKKTAAA